MSQSAATFSTPDEIDNRHRRNNLDIDQCAKGINLAPRVSTSEPLAAPSGYKVLMTAMEIGLVRDVVDRVLITHDYLLSRHNLIGKAYVACVESVTTGFNVADYVVKTTEEIYCETFPSFFVRRTSEAHMLVWNKWVDLDETVSTKVSNQLSQHPFFRKTSTEIIHDVEKSVEETRIWQFGKIVNDKLQEIYEMLRPHSKDGEENPDDNSDNYENDPNQTNDLSMDSEARIVHSPPKAVESSSDKSSKDKKKRSRGQTAGGRNQQGAASANISEQVLTRRNKR